MLRHTTHITVQLENSYYQSGDTLCGTVSLFAEKDVRARGVQLKLRWQARKTSGTSHHSDEGVVNKVVLELPNHNLRAGFQRILPFELTTPDGPASYHGSTFEIIWTLHAKLLTGNPLAASAKVHFELSPSSTRPYWHGPKFKLHHSRINLVNITTTSVITLISLLFVLFGLVFIELFGDELAGFLIAIFFAFLGSFGLYWQHRALLAKMTFTTLISRLSTRTVSPGETLTCNLKFVSWRNLRVHRVRVDLHAIERYTMSSRVHSTSISPMPTAGGKGRVTPSRTQLTTKTKTVFVRTIRLWEDEKLKAFEPLTAALELKFPEDVPYSFAAANNQLLWRVVIRFYAGAMPIWRKVIPIVVKPKNT